MDWRNLKQWEIPFGLNGLSTTAIKIDRNRKTYNNRLTKLEQTAAVATVGLKIYLLDMDGYRGGDRGSGPPLENHKWIQVSLEILVQTPSLISNWTLLEGGS